MDKKQLHAFTEQTQPNICQIVALRDGCEAYTDEWNGYTQTDACHVMSVTKGVVALLVGIALDMGLIEDVNQPVLSFFPDYPVKRGEKTIQLVTLRHLLTMTAPYKYKSEPWTRVCTSPDWTAAALDLLGGRSGITGEFKYSTLGVHILTGILSKVSGMKTVDFANKYLFEPIGAARHENYFALSAEEHREFTVSRLPKANVWFADPQGIGTAGYGLCLSARDMAKIGLLCLNGGECGGRRIVSREWIKAMTTPCRRLGKEFANMSYGYLWWIIDEARGIYAALGNSGNVIYVNPANGAVVAVTGWFKPTVLDRVDFIQKYIEPGL